MSSLGNAFGGQSLADRVNAARYALAGQGLARVVCKATTEELLGPKKKHLDYLLQCTHEPNVSIPNMANLLIERAIAPSSSWIVVFKALISMHHLMCYGNERFCQYLASAPDVGLDNLSKNWVDRTSAPGAIEMTVFVRRYCVYVLTRIATYRNLGYDLSKVKRDSNTIRGLTLERLLETIPKIQGQVDALIGFDAKERDLNNPVIRAAFLILFRDLVRLFASYNDSIICLLEKFFKIEERKQARTAFAFYMSFAERMPRIALFLKTAEAIGVEKGEIPDLAQAPASIINALEAHCYVLEGKDPSEVLNRPPPVLAPPQPPPAPVAPVHPPPPMGGPLAYQAVAPAHPPPPTAMGVPSPYGVVPGHAAPPPPHPPPPTAMAMAGATAGAAPTPPRPPPAAFNPFLDPGPAAVPAYAAPGPAVAPALPPQPTGYQIPAVYQSHPPPPVPPQPAPYIPQQPVVAPQIPPQPSVAIPPQIPPQPSVPIAPVIPPQPVASALPPQLPPQPSVVPVAGVPPVAAVVPPTSVPAPVASSFDSTTTSQAAPPPLPAAPEPQPVAVADATPAEPAPAAVVNSTNPFA